MTGAVHVEIALLARWDLTKVRPRMTTSAARLLAASLALLLGAALVGCASSDDDGSSAASAISSARWPARPVDPGACAGTPVAGKLTVYVIPPPVALDWSTPNRLIATALEAQAAEGLRRASGKVKVAHGIGHLHLALDCGAHSIPLTGQSGGKESWQSVLDGFGVLLRDYRGRLDAMANPDDVAEDVERRQERGLLSRMSFLVSEATCTRIKEFYDTYVARRAYQHYSGIYRARRFEGAGCGIFGADVIDLAGLLRRSVFTPPWVRTLFVGSARFSNVGGDDHFHSGSNLVARGVDGRSVIWPRGVAIPTNGSAIVPGIPRLRRWTGPEDEPFAGLALAPPIHDALPFSIYDPELMADWVERVWRQASAAGSADAFEARWTASTVDGAHEITTDAHCTPPQAIPFDQDSDDLFADSDAR